MIQTALAALAVVSIGYAGWRFTRPEPSIAEVAMDPPLAFLAVDGMTEARANAFDLEGNRLHDRIPVWSSMDTLIATVGEADSTGAVLIRGIAPGITTTQARFTSGWTSQATVVVQGDAASEACACVLDDDSTAGGSGVRPTQAPPPPVVDRVILTNQTGDVDVSGQLRMGATIVDAAGTPVTGRPVQWSSSDPQVASVNERGVVYGRGPGSARIRATVDGVTAEAAINVRHLDPPASDPSRTQRPAVEAWIAAVRRGDLPSIVAPLDAADRQAWRAMLETSTVSRAELISLDSRDMERADIVVALILDNATGQQQVQLRYQAMFTGSRLVALRRVQ